MVACFATDATRRFSAEQQQQQLCGRRLLRATLQCPGKSGTRVLKEDPRSCRVLPSTCVAASCSPFTLQCRSWARTSAVHGCNDCGKQAIHSGADWGVCVCALPMWQSARQGGEALCMQHLTGRGFACSVHGQGTVCVVHVAGIPSDDVTHRGCVSPQHQVWT